MWFNQIVLFPWTICYSPRSSFPENVFLQLNIWTFSHRLSQTSCSTSQSKALPTQKAKKCCQSHREEAYLQPQSGCSPDIFLILSRGINMFLSVVIFLLYHGFLTRSSPSCSSSHKWSMTWLRQQKARCTQDYLVSWHFGLENHLWHFGNSRPRLYLFHSLCSCERQTARGS